MCNLATVVNGNSQAHCTTTREVPTNTPNSRLSSGVGIVNRRRIRGDARASTPQRITDLHALHGQARILRLDGRDIETRPAAVPGAGEIELAPGRGIPAIRVLGDAACSGRKSAVGVVVKGDVLGLSGIEGEGQSSVAVPAGHLAIGADLIPEDDGPRFTVLAADLGDVLVVGGRVGGDFDDVATPWVADVAGVGLAAAAVGGAAAEARGGVGASGWGGGPGGAAAGG